MIMVTNPAISVLMPAYNAGGYLKKSIESILNQKFADFEFLIMDDGSTDGSREIISSYAGSDGRIKQFSSDENLGIVYQLNRGIKLARGRYIARMDADDISLPGRLEKQFDFMEENPHIDISGTWMRTFGVKKGRALRTPLCHDEIFAKMLFDCAVFHATAIIRKASVRGPGEFYSGDYPFSEDTEYWIRLSLLGLKFAALGEVLYLVREHEDRVSRKKDNIQRENSLRAKLGLWEKLGVYPGAPAESSFLEKVISRGPFQDLNEIERAYLLLDKARRENRKKKLFSQRSLEKQLAASWFRICSKASGRGMASWRLYRARKNHGTGEPGYGEEIKFLIKCILSIETKKDLLLFSKKRV